MADAPISPLATINIEAPSVEITSKTTRVARRAMPRSLRRVDVRPPNASKHKGDGSLLSV